MILTENSPQAAQPQNIGIHLKPHQLASLYQMLQLDQNCGVPEKNLNTNMGFLADHPGYGKTITFLSLIQELKGVTGKWIPQIKVNIFRNYGLYSTTTTQVECLDTTLIVVPDKLVKHWYNHLKNFTELSFEIVSQEEIDKICVEQYDVIVCPAALYNKFVTIHDHFWNRVAFDECDSIQIPNMLYIRTRFLWMISTTFEQLSRRRNRGFLTELFREYGYGTIERSFEPVIIRGQDEFVKRSFGLVDPVVIFIDCLMPAVLSAVRAYIEPAILTMLNAGDIDNAIIRLGGSMTTDRNIIDLVVRNLNNDMIRLRARLTMIQQLEMSEEDRGERVERVNQQIRSLEQRQASFETSFREALQTSCTICLDALEHATLVPCCNNIFCAKCIVQWLHAHKTCPLCRAVVEPSKLCTLKENSTSTTTATTTSINSSSEIVSKFETLVKLIQKHPEGRFVVFSGHQTSYRELQGYLRNARIQFGVMTTANNTMNTLANFKSGALNVILLDAVNNGAGLEIQEATHVVLLHEMSPNLELQAIGRAQRPGRVGQLHVIKLKYEHEYRQEGVRHV